MVLVKSVKFGHVFIFRQISQKKEFNIQFGTKKCFQDDKKEKFKKIEELGFFQRG